jgi:outer membrane scaffolding protein for murein synthesis (MipA/OmpV family)
MKKVILSAVAVFAFGFANAQETKFGIKAGLNIANVTNVEGAKSKIGFAAGGFADVKLSEKFHVQPELLFSTQGAKFESFGTTGSFNLNYINIPVMAKYYVVEGFNLQAGPQIGFLMSAKSEFGGESLDVKENLKTLDFGLNFGAGYDINENIMIDVRYNLGLSQLDKEVADGEKVAKNSVIQIGVGYKF